MSGIPKIIERIRMVSKAVAKPNPIGLWNDASFPVVKKDSVSQIKPVETARRITKRFMASCIFRSYIRAKTARTAASVERNRWRESG
jgi:hypothetical protein